MGDTRAEGERNFWNEQEAVTAIRPKPAHIKDVEELRFEGGSDHFTSNRHQLHNQERMAFFSTDDAPFIRPKPLSQPQISHTITAPEGCEKVTDLLKRSNM